jgi:hypothetical protein
MCSGAPSFGQRQYWDDRYASNPKSYDWLNEAGILDKHLDTALAKYEKASPRVLHIGCGNSELSFSLRFKVRDPGQIHNIDYSTVVIDWGRDQEKALFDSRWEADTEISTLPAPPQPSMPMMQWDTVDLLSLQSVISKCSLGSYSIVLDKSTCDSLACTSTTKVPIPYFLYTDKRGSDSFLDIAASYTGTANAVQLLAVHLALVAKPSAMWIAYSYSSTRFWFLDADSQPESEEQSPVPLHPGLPHPKDLWTLVKRQNVMRPYGNHGETTATEAGDTHFVYVLERSATALNVRSMTQNPETPNALKRTKPA